LVGKIYVISKKNFGKNKKRKNAFHANSSFPEDCSLHALAPSAGHQQGSQLPETSPE
jgi:hypothetical protein